MHVAGFLKDNSKVTTIIEEDVTKMKTSIASILALLHGVL